MALLDRFDLRFTYQWPDACPALARGPAPGPFPGTGPLDRRDGPTVLNFVNAVAAASEWTEKALGLKAEALVHALPPAAGTCQQAYA